MSRFYANITLRGPAADEVAAYLSAEHESAYISPSVRSAIVVFHEDMQNQEALAAKLSAHFSCPALLVMAYAEIILLYHLYENGKQTDAYVSSPHADLELDAPAPQGNSVVLCAAFETDRFERRVESILRKEAKSDHAFANAINRHGELFQALGLPVFAAGASFQSIEIGEMPAGKGFEVGEMVRTK